MDQNNDLYIHSRFQKKTKILKHISFFFDLIIFNLA